MMKIVLDSNRYTDFCRGIPEVVEIVSSAQVIYLPLIVIAELRAGFSFGNQREKNERVLSLFLQNEGIFTLAPDTQTTYYYAELYSYLRKKGKPIPTNDLWIAALCIQHQVTLFDRDSDFDHIPQLNRVNI
ncbi:MAG: type II toxin-antitoxin system VapC family toxin [Bacteriovoracaceae bacterium]|nr:type II toxin-antitoxin system VapC family toxin [Bacteriovoracaceae bacterium]